MSKRTGFYPPLTVDTTFYPPLTVDTTAKRVVSTGRCGAAGREVGRDDLTEPDVHDIATDQANGVDSLPPAVP